jgi:ABC-type polysaccharide/polyol phosphate export permease
MTARDMIPQCYIRLFRLLPLVSFMASARRRSGLANTLLGGLWNVLNPLAQLGIYYFLVEVVFQRTGSYPTNAALFIIVGIAHYTFLQRGLTACASSVFSNERLLLQLKIEPLVFVAIAIRQAATDLLYATGICVLFFAVLGPPKWHGGLLAYPLLLILLLLFVWAWSVIFATLSVYLRDLPNALGVGLRLLLYSSPVIYPASMLPERFEPLMVLNPLGGWFTALHWSLFGGAAPSAAAMGVFGGFLVGSLILSHVLYRALQPGFTKVF